jgi:hypothetical protein
MNQSLPSDYEKQLSAAADFIREHDDFLVVSHVNPDGDAVSSTLAVGHLLGQLGKTYELANEGRTPQKFYRLAGAETIVNVSASPFTRSFKHIISVDCADFGRIGAVDRHFDIDYKLLNIDHHPTNDRFGAVPLVKDDAAATVEIISDLAHQLQADWSMPLCECIYTGLLTDTGGFRYSNTSPKVMAIASDMLARGEHFFYDGFTGINSDDSGCSIDVNADVLRRVEVAFIARNQRRLDRFDQNIFADSLRRFNLVQCVDKIRVHLRWIPPSNTCSADLRRLRTTR